MSDPDQITVTLSREEAEQRVSRFEAMAAGSAALATDRELENGLGDDLAELRAAASELRAAIDNPQPSDTGRYEEALRERLLSDEAVEAAVRSRCPIWEADVDEHTQEGEMLWDETKASIEAALDAALQPTGEKHGN